MKIDNSVNSVGPSGEPRARPKKGQPASSASPAGAQVKPSSLSSQLEDMEASLTNVPPVDAQRVAELKQAISEGRFKVDADKVADSLIRSVRQMLSAQTRQA